VNSQANLDGDGQLRAVDAAQPDRFWRWVLAAAAGFAVLIGLAFFVVPVLTIPNLGKIAPDDLAAARGTVRGNALQAVGAIAIGVGLMLTARSVTIATRSLAATREAHLGDRVVHVIELLESDEIAVRVGGVYSLERIAEQAPMGARDHLRSTDKSRSRACLVSARHVRGLSTGRRPAA
jgi:hypothetical protein